MRVDVRKATRILSWIWLPIGIPVATGCAGFDSPVDSGEFMVLVRYGAGQHRTFSMAGTGNTRMNLQELKDALLRQRTRHPGAVYELVAETKQTKVFTEKVIQIFQEAGAELRHYWVPESDFDPEGITEERPGASWEGFVDLLRP